MCTLGAAGFLGISGRRVVIESWCIPLTCKLFDRLFHQPADGHPLGAPLFGQCEVRIAHLPAGGRRYFEKLFLGPFTVPVAAGVHKAAHHVTHRDTSQRGGLTDISAPGKIVSTGFLGIMLQQRPIPAGKGCLIQSGGHIGLQYRHIWHLGADAADGRIAPHGFQLGLGVGKAFFQNAVL